MPINDKEPAPLMEVSNLYCSYLSNSVFSRTNNDNKLSKHLIVRDVSFEIRSGETFALVGESGSGKTTIMRAVGGLLTPVRGTIKYKSKDITTLVDERSKEVRREIQIVFQNPDSSLNPRRRISSIIGRPYELFFGLEGSSLKEKIESSLVDVNLDPKCAHRFPAQLSKGERQRIAITTGLAANPSLMLCDEILSSLDVSVQASIIDLLIDLQEKHKLAYLFISHDLAVVRSIAHQVGVLYLGKLCEKGVVQDVFRPPFHPYTEVLLMAVPRAVPGYQVPEIVLAAGEFKSLRREKGCVFASRCPRKIGAICTEEDPPLQRTENGHEILCHIPLDTLEKMQGAIGEIL